MKEREAKKGFIVVSRDIIEDNRLSAFERLLLIHIGAFGEFYESTKTTARLFGVSECKIQRAKQALVKARCIVAVSNKGRGKRYIINDKYLWKSSPKMWKSMCKSSGKVEFN